MSVAAGKSRIFEIDRAKGLAILLVVIGHVEGRTPLHGADWYGVMKQWIYLFHMPFFMFLSGFIMEYTYKPVTTASGYFKFVRGKFIRLMPAFFAVAGLIVLGKTIAAHLIHVDNVPQGIWSGLIDIVVRPVYSSASALWYIYVLFIYYFLFPILKRVSGGEPWLILSIGVVAYVFHADVTSLFALNRVAYYMLFLMIGIILASHFTAFTRGLDKFGWVALGLFIVLSLFHPMLPYPKLVLGLVSIPALIFFIRLPVIRNSEVLLAWGKYVFVIYLLNTLFIGLVKGIGLKVMPWDGLNFLIYFPILAAAGMLLPIAFKKWVLAKWPPLDRMTT
jgi:fucose 4-O-acetylase-like acetyltransferase